MRRFARFCELVIGAVFVVGAAMKAHDIPGFAVGIRQYQVIFNPLALQWLAVFTITVETVLGIALLVGWRLRGLVHAASIAVLVFFSGMIAYAWAAHGLEDCGCFGGYVKMGPGPSLLKNAAMIAMLALPWVVYARRRQPLPWSISGGVARAATALVVLVAVAGMAAFGNPALVRDEGGGSSTTPPPTGAPEGPFAGIVVSNGGQSASLRDGKYLVAVMSATCEHCKASVGPLNELMAGPGIPPVVALMMGDEAELEQFRAETAPLFPTQLVPTMTWLDLLGDAPAPPRYVLVVDGVERAHWDDIVPEPEAIETELASP